jgi:hypothetical protein
MKYITFISIIIISLAASGQEDITRGLLNNETKDSVFQNLIILNNLSKEQDIGNIDNFKKEWKVSTVVVCPQNDEDTLFVVFKANYTHHTPSEIKKKGKLFVFDENGKHVKLYGNKSSLGGEILDIYSDGKIELIDSHLIKPGGSGKREILNYLYIIPVKAEPVTTFGIAFYRSWSWKTVDINNDSIIEIQIGPRKDKAVTLYSHTTEVDIDPKVTFQWSAKKNKFIATNKEYRNMYKVIDFEIPEYSTKQRRKFWRIIKKL